MKKIGYFISFFSLLIYCPLNLFGKNSKAAEELTAYYKKSHKNPSDICEHLPTLRQLSRECSSVVEIGMRSMVSSWGILKGLSENATGIRSYTGIDLSQPPKKTLKAARKLARANKIAFTFIQDNDLNVTLPNVDFLFIDSLHTYCHLTYELEKFSPSVNKYIGLHDTSDPWGTRDELYSGDYSEYPISIVPSKKGLWPAVEDFLQRHPEWTLVERKLNCHGFTILKRI